jgi:hypothetical protein
MQRPLCVQADFTACNTGTALLRDAQSNKLMPMMCRRDMDRQSHPNPAGLSPATCGSASASRPCRRSRAAPSQPSHSGASTPRDPASVPASAACRRPATGGGGVMRCISSAPTSSPVCSAPLRGAVLPHTARARTESTHIWKFRMVTQRKLSKPSGTQDLPSEHSPWAPEAPRSSPRLCQQASQGHTCWHGCVSSQHF